jgi:hypothetical protein
VVHGDGHELVDQTGLFAWEKGNDLVTQSDGLLDGLRLVQNVEHEMGDVGA